MAAILPPVYRRTSFPPFMQLTPISSSSPITEVISKLRASLRQAIDSSYAYDQLRTPPLSSQLIRPILRWLTKSKHPGIILALIWCKMEFDDRANGERNHDSARGWAAELLAIRLLSNYTPTGLINSLTTEFDPRDSTPATPATPPRLDDRAPLLAPGMIRSTSDISSNSVNALELAILAPAKHFLASSRVQEVLNAVWRGEVVFWTTMNVDSHKKAVFYKPHIHGRTLEELYSRLRVPRSRVLCETVNRVIFLALYLWVLAATPPEIGWLWKELVLLIWICGYVLDEVQAWRDNAGLWWGDLWWGADVGLCTIWFAWAGVRLFGLLGGEGYWGTATVAWNVLGLAAIILVPRCFSVFSLIPYFGILMPCLRRLTWDFLKFMILVAVIYVGFVITFCVLGRENFGIQRMSWILIRIFFGSSYVGFDEMYNINPVFGPTLMVIFVTVTQILLVTILIAILSNSFSTVMNNAREEYLFLFAATCIESTISDHLVVFFPPFNILTIILLRPFRLFLSHSSPSLRRMKLWLLFITHSAFVLLVAMWESLERRLPNRSANRPGLSKARTMTVEELLRSGDGGTPFRGGAGGIGFGIGLRGSRPLRSGTASEDETEDETQYQDGGIGELRERIGRVESELRLLREELMEAVGKRVD
ncbi:hypothetical protein SAICODRAFT_141210 [Saitoella complicata NRRL Y-17804]|uniref:Ion transport domain-containing protein n=1 Tax=Saitoella complicata (strain BCRC 22490 / CBS 7301 / JCM 7358 / NBRC 10748 / NRRL Y-17804) TaxID=698492 RepID=A0A0E9NFH7_SAICN|nr:uncharacterized protein SAICODRAFT_141210 [Saitoella complicata NRRL Y-17804]ODQ51991.1 hypothetical protein SAICODRAFT_141210 [Saitoella complicata NRRL Y-17804]GAO48617.1 hypothetical protein G7K_2788-t1 [Saitoella complicata NRRL Y-17804]